MASSHSLLVLCLLALVMAMANASQYKVGWAVPANPKAMSLNQWAERNRFQIGDSLVFVYPANADSVLQVTQDAYTACDTSSPIKHFNEGNTVFTFDKSGPYYFISGRNEYCRRNEKMVVVVMADRSNRSNSTNPAISPAMAPATPTSTTPPSPPPPAEVPPPAPATTEVTPAPPPTGEESRSPPPRPNSATLKAVGIMSSVGALFGSLIFAF